MSTSRVTTADIDNAFRRMIVAAQACKIDTRDLCLVKGSTTYGRGWRIARIHPVTGGHYEWSINYLGATPREALAALRTATDAFWGVAGTNVPRTFAGEPRPTLAQDDPARKVRTA